MTQEHGAPKVSILVLNYNSYGFIDVVLNALNAICDLDYPHDKYELIIVDNGSTDGSFEKIKNFLEGKTFLKKKIIKLKRNLGFTGGNNVAYRARDPECEYVVLLNNDVIPDPEGLRILIEFIYSRPDIAAVQGVLLRLQSDLVDSAGNFLTEALFPILFMNGKELASVPRRAYFCSYTTGAYSVYRVKAVEKAVRFRDKLFYDFIFAYFDDSYLGLKLWNAGQKSATLPIVVGRHFGSASFKQRKPLLTYLSVRNHLIALEVSDSKYRWLVKLARLREVAANPISRFVRRGRFKDETVRFKIKAIADGIRLGKRLRSMGEFIDIYKAPLVRLGMLNAAPLLPLREPFRRSLSKLIEKRLHKLIDNLYVE